MEMKRTIKSGELYKHFKGNLYQIVAIASHSETEEKMVVYQALYGTYDIYVRPYEMFLGELDQNQYPDVKQTYRFEKIDRNTLSQSKESEPAAMIYQCKEEKLSAIAPVMASKSKEDEMFSGKTEDGINRALLCFLDADTCEEKLKVLEKIKKYIDEKIMTGIEISLDLTDSNGSMDDRLDLVRRNLHTRAKFESSRLR